MKYNKLGKTGLSVSALGFGGSTLAHCYQTPQEDEGIKTVVEAVQNGINYIDTAPYYGEGRAEIVLGKALREIPRDSFYLATKVGRYTADIPTMFDFSSERTFASIDESLQKLGVEYVDIIQVHDVEFAPSIDIIVNETLPALQKIKECGKAKFIGITGYPIHTLKEILNRSTVPVDVVLSYCRCTLFDDALLKDVQFFKRKGLGLINAAILGMGLLTSQGLPIWHPVIPEVKTACLDAANYCKKMGVDIAKLATYYSLSQPGIDTHLIGMADQTSLRKNLDVLENGLSYEEHNVLKEIQSRFFSRLSQHNWENVELECYRNEMKQKSV